MLYVMQDMQDQDGTALPSWSCPKAVYKPVWHIPLLSVQWMNSWWWTDELSETCRVSCQNKFVKLVHLVGFIIKKLIYDALSHERKIRLKNVYWTIQITENLWIFFQLLRFTYTPQHRVHKLYQPFYHRLRHRHHLISTIQFISLFRLCPRH